MIAPDITRLSPNFNGFPVVGRTVIIHATRSGVPMNPTEFTGTLNYMAEKGTTSSNWVVSRKGEKARVVPDSRQAWHAGNDNARSWGIELEQGDEADGFTPEQIAALVEICRGYMEDFGVPAVHAAAPWGDGFIGHQETNQGKSYGKSDPGHLFPWGAFIAALQPAPPVPVPAPVFDSRDITISIDAAIFDLQAALATKRLIARHSDDGKSVIVVDPASGADLGAWLPVK